MRVRLSSEWRDWGGRSSNRQWVCCMLEDLMVSWNCVVLACAREKGRRGRKERWASGVDGKKAWSGRFVRVVSRHLVRKVQGDLQSKSY